MRISQKKFEVKKKRIRERKIERKGREKMESMRCLSKNQIVHVLNIKSDLYVVRFFEKRFLKKS